VGALEFADELPDVQVAYLPDGNVPETRKDIPVHGVAVILQGRLLDLFLDDPDPLQGHLPEERFWTILRGSAGDFSVEHDLPQQLIP